MAKCNGRFITKKSAGYKVIYDPVDVGISVSNSVRSDGGGGGSGPRVPHWIRHPLEQNERTNASMNDMNE